MCPTCASSAFRLGALLALLLWPLALAAMSSGDADCNGLLDAADVTAVADAVFTDSPCAAADANGDGRLTAADLPAEMQALAMPAGSSRFGVIISGQRVARPEVVDIVNDLGAGWVRLNLTLDGDPTNDQAFRLFLDAGVNVVLTLSNRNPLNSDQTQGALADWSSAGFPYVSQTQYALDVANSLAPVLDLLGSGRVWVQCENEVGDATVNRDARYWRGTTAQYLAQVDAFFDAVRAVNPAVPVVLSSFASGSLDIVLDPTDLRHAYEVDRMTTMLTSGRYAAADLHFYGCVSDILAKVQWVKDRLPAGKRWISTENGGPDPRCPATPISWDRNASLFEQTEAQQVPARLHACADNGGSVCLWFSLFDLQGETSVFSHLGLLDQSQLPPRQKPAYAAFKSFTARPLGPFIEF